MVEDYSVQFEELEKEIPTLRDAIVSGMGLGVLAKGSNKLLKWDPERNSYVVLDGLDQKGEFPTLVPEQIEWKDITVFAHAIPHIQRVVSRALQKK